MILLVQFVREKKFYKNKKPISFPLTLKRNTVEMRTSSFFEVSINAMRANVVVVWAVVIS